MNDYNDRSGDAGRRRHRQTVGFEPIDVEANRVADFGFGRLDRLADGDAAGRVAHIGRVIAIRLLDHDRIAHHYFAACHECHCSRHARA
jgi:hypothetical protein